MSREKRFGLEKEVGALKGKRVVQIRRRWGLDLRRRGAHSRERDINLSE